LNENKIDVLEKRLNTLETIQATQNEILKSINEKLECIQINQNHYMPKTECIIQYTNLEKVLSIFCNKFDKHLESHFNKVDKYATWLTTALMAAFVIGKIAKLF